MKAYFSFDFENNWDREEFDACRKGKDCWLALLDLNNKLRDAFKYKRLDKKTLAVLEEVEKEFNQTLEAYEIDMDMLS